MTSEQQSVSSAELAKTVDQTVATQIRPMLEVHGGGIDVLEVHDSGDIDVRLTGACRACALKSVTYAIAVRQRLRQISGVRNVSAEGINISDHALKRVETAYAGHSMMLGDRHFNKESSE